MICCNYFVVALFIFFCKQKTAYEMRISDWSSDVCSSDLLLRCNIKDIGHNDALIGLKEDPGEIVGPQAVRGMIASTVNPFSKSAGRDEKARPGEAGMEERGEGLLGMPRAYF